MLENCHNNISVYGCSPNQGTTFYSGWNLMKPGSQSGTYASYILCTFLFPPVLLLSPLKHSLKQEAGGWTTCLYETIHLYTCLFRHMFLSQLDLFPGPATGSFDCREYLDCSLGFPYVGQVWYWGCREYSDWTVKFLYVCQVWYWGYRVYLDFLDSFDGRELGNIHHVM